MSLLEDSLYDEEGVLRDPDECEEVSDEEYNRQSEIESDWDIYEKGGDVY